MSDTALSGRTIGITAERRAEEQIRLFEARGAAVLWGPTLATVDHSRDPVLRETTAGLIATPPDSVIVTTGMGMRLWIEAASSWGMADALHAVLAGARIIARGAKSASAVRGAGLNVAWQAPTERMDDIIGHLAAEPAGQRASMRVALQLFEPAGHPSTESVRALVGDLVAVPIYQWTLPTDLAPAKRLIAAVIAREVAAITFTSQPAVYHLFQIASTSGADTTLRDALNGPVLPACIGPVCAAAAQDSGVTAPVWPEPNRLPALVRLVTERVGTQ